MVRVIPAGTLSKEKFKKWVDGPETIEIVILNTVEEAPSEAEDLSEEEDGSILGWTNEGRVFLAGDGGIKAPEDCSYLFTDLSEDDKSYRDNSKHWSNLTSVTGAEYLDMSGVTTAKCMFIYCSGLKSIDVSCWNTERITDMRRQFCFCCNLKELDVSGWDTSNVSSMKGLFWGCRSVKSIDVKS